MSGKSAKKPLERRVRINLDDEPIEALEAARRELAEAEARAYLLYDRRIASLRPADFTPQARSEALARLAVERDEALTPFRNAVGEAEKAVADVTETWVFRAIGRPAYRALIDEHPATDESNEELRQASGNPNARLPWDDDTFYPALLAASCVEPGLTLDEATEIYNNWAVGESDELIKAAVEACTGTRLDFLGKARG